MISDTLFTVCPWWDGPLVKSRLESQLREAAAQRLQQWIWVHHAPPANSPTSWGGKRFFGDVELVQWIKDYQPSMVISGHVHLVPLHPRRLLVRPARRHLGIQHRPAARPSAGLHRARPRWGAAFWLAAGEAQCIDLRAPLLRPAAPIKIRRPGSSLGRIADPSLARPATAAVIMLCRFADHRQMIHRR